mmetsp:Transcript_12115/g.16639  ORF Transcript_12115/g.16639 Transcript_12115/m.16639 type:complete len:90 (+) Transcript_12115:92-361(+)
MKQNLLLQNESPMKRLFLHMKRILIPNHYQKAHVFSLRYLLNTFVLILTLVLKVHKIATLGRLRTNQLMYYFEKKGSGDWMGKILKTLV